MHSEIGTVGYGQTWWHPGVDWYGSIFGPLRVSRSGCLKGLEPNRPVFTVENPGPVLNTAPILSVSPCSILTSSMIATTCVWRSDVPWMFRNSNPIAWKQTAHTKPDLSKTAFLGHPVVVVFHPCAAVHVLVPPPPCSITSLSASGIISWVSAATKKLRSWMHTNRFHCNASNAHWLRSQNHLCCMLPWTEIPTEKSLGNFRKFKQYGQPFYNPSSCHLGGGGARGSSGPSV